MEEIIKIQRNHEGQIISFQTSSGRIISYQKALMEAQEGVLSGVNVEHDGEGISQLANSYNGDITFSELPEIF
jgi:regulatory protein YycI of two-component signal transduction system YycFG